MRAYRNIRFIEGPDVADIQEQGRKSIVGRLDEKSYFRKPEHKAKVRRLLKRQDRMKQYRIDRRDEE